MEYHGHEAMVRSLLVVGALTWTEDDHRAGLPLDLNSNPIVQFLEPRAGRSSCSGLGTAAAPVAGHRFSSTGPGAGSPV